jgi:hypothetical protein
MRHNQSQLIRNAIIKNQMLAQISNQISNENHMPSMGCNKKSNQNQMLAQPVIKI